MNIHAALTLTNPAAIGTALGEAQASLGAATSRHRAALRRWRDSLLQDDLREAIAARAALGTAAVDLERAEAFVERLGDNLDRLGGGFDLRPQPPQYPAGADVR